MSAPRRLALATAMAVLLVRAAPLPAQEFAGPSPAAAAGAGDLLERGLPPAALRVGVDALYVRYPFDLTTRALIGAAGWGEGRMALGIARTGDEALGWSAAGVGLGFATPRAGAALRGVVRRDDAREPGEPDAGAEAGLGAWVGAAPWRVWTSAPQVWTGGLAPPLARGLEIGAGLEASGVGLAVRREAPRRGFAEPAAWSGRVGLSVAGIEAWTEFRERPWRGGLGLATRARAVRVAAEVDAHPVLEPTVRLLVGVGAGP